MNPLNFLNNAFAADSATTLSQRGAAIEAALARNIAFNLPLPSTPVEGLAKHFSTVCSSLVRNLVSKFNEGYAINVQQTTDLVYVIWKFRYNIVHPNTIAKQDSFVLAALSVSEDSLKSDLSPRYSDLVYKELSYDAISTICGFVNSALAKASAE